MCISECHYESLLVIITVTPSPLLSSLRSLIHYLILLGSRAVISWFLFGHFLAPQLSERPSLRCTSKSVSRCVSIKCVGGPSRGPSQWLPWWCEKIDLLAPVDYIDCLLCSVRWQMISFHFRNCLWSLLSVKIMWNGLLTWLGECKTCMEPHPSHIEPHPSQTCN